MVQLSSLILCVSLLSGLASAAPLRVRHHNNKTAAATTGTLAATSGTVAANTAGSVAATGTFTVLECVPFSLVRVPFPDLLISYADFQISDGVAGNAAAEANAVFVGMSTRALPLIRAQMALCRPLQWGGPIYRLSGYYCRHPPLLVVFFGLKTILGECGDDA